MMQNANTELPRVVDVGARLQNIILDLVAIEDTQEDHDLSFRPGEYSDGQEFLSAATSPNQEEGSDDTKHVNWPP